MDLLSRKRSFLSLYSGEIFMTGGILWQGRVDQLVAVKIQNVEPWMYVQKIFILQGTAGMDQ